MITKERLENIKENVYMRSEIAKISGLGIDTSLKEELELIEEIDRLNELEKYIVEEIDYAQEELNTILQGNDLEYKNECTKEFNCIKNALDMLLDKLKELKENK